MISLWHQRQAQFSTHLLRLWPFTASAAVGAAAWSGHLIGFLLAPLMIVLWGRARSRSEAFAVALGYYLATGRGLVIGAGVFFGDSTSLPHPIPGLLLWLGYAVLISAGWTMTWGTRAKALRLILALLLISIPPLGIVGGFNPLLSAGLFFPGLGWIGLCLIIIWFCVLVTIPTRTIVTLPFAAIALIANTVFRAPALPNWSSIDTSLGPAASSSEQYDRMMHLQRAVATWSTTHKQGSVLVLPELVGDDWSMNQQWWNSVDRNLKRRQQTVLLGAYVPIGNGKVYENVVVSIGQVDGVKFRDRVPVPISMWKPWTNEGALAFWTESGVHRINNRQVASLICYEQLLVWPVMLSLLENPDVLVAPANDWWATHTNLPDLQRQSVQAWARLFSIPFIWSTNR